VLKSNLDPTSGVIVFADAVRCHNQIEIDEKKIADIDIQSLHPSVSEMLN